VTRVRYSKDAERDLSEIVQYTIETWGVNQASRYLDLLQQTCEQIVPQHAHLARPVPKRPGLFAWRCERHMVYFRRFQAVIQIVRILHERMLPESYL